MTKGTLTRIDISDSISRNVGLSRQQAVDLMESVLATLASNIVKGGEAKLSSFGTFSVRHKGDRVGRNPKTGQEVVIQPRRTLSFRASQILKDRVESAPR